MRFQSIDRYTGVFSISLSELIVEYDKPNAAGYKRSYICFVLCELASKYFTKLDGGRVIDCVDDEAITIQFRAQWMKKVFGREVKNDDGDCNTIDGWNEGTPYGVENFGWDSLDEYVDSGEMKTRRDYRKWMMERVLYVVGDMEFSFNVSVIDFWRDQF